MAKTDTTALNNHKAGDSAQSLRLHTSNRVIPVSQETMRLARAIELMPKNEREMIQHMLQASVKIHGAANDVKGDHA